jgi:hypothetical protein
MKEIYTYQELKSLFEESIKKAQEFESVSDDLLATKPDVSSWSVSEIFQHVVNFNRIYLRFIDRSIRKPKTLPTTKKNSFSTRFAAGYLVRIMLPPYKIKIPTIAPMKPENSDLEEIKNSLQELIETNQEILKYLGEAEEKNLDINRIKGKNSVFKISMTVVEFLLVFDAHQRRHFWQAEQTLNRLREQSP